jgi:hypothetical protein
VPLAVLPEWIGLLFSDGPSASDWLTPLTALLDRMAFKRLVVVNDLHEAPRFRARCVRVPTG